MEGIIQRGAHKLTIDHSCLVRFVCPKCKGEEVRDAYRGPVVHWEPCRAVMVPDALIHPPRPQLKGARHVG